MQHYSLFVQKTSLALSKFCIICFLFSIHVHSFSNKMTHGPDGLEDMRPYLKFQDYAHPLGSLDLNLWQQFR